LRNGRIIEEGGCEEVFASPKSAYTRALLDAIPLPRIDPGWLVRGSGVGDAVEENGAK
jgi:ABC-type dipeptide/oligopeptide/nickel transport system ATPase component